MDVKTYDDSLWSGSRARSRGVRRGWTAKFHRPGRPHNLEEFTLTGCRDGNECWEVTPLYPLSGAWDDLYVRMGPVRKLQALDFSDIQTRLSINDAPSPFSFTTKAQVSAIGIKSMNQHQVRPTRSVIFFLSYPCTLASPARTPSAIPFTKYPNYRSIFS